MLSRFCRPTVNLVRNDRIPAYVDFSDLPAATQLDGFVQFPVYVVLDTPVRRRYEDRDRDLIVEDWIVVAWARDVHDERTVRFVSTTTLRDGDTPESIRDAFGTDIFRSLIEANLLDEEDDHD